jgi:hypothetical protein
MLKTWVGCLVLALLVLPAVADKKKPAAKAPVIGKGFWKILVKPNAKWVLHSSEQPKGSITVETYDVRKVDGADVARIRWTFSSDGKEKEDISEDGAKPAQVAVTDKGIYFLSGKADDAKVSVALKTLKKPTRSDPPKPYEPTKLNNGRYLAINPEGFVCMGYQNLTGECADTCEGWVCISPTDGVTEISGTYAPNLDTWKQ